MQNLNDLRRMLRDKAEKSINVRGTLEFIPPLGRTNVRFLPGRDDEELFYYTHSFHYLPNDGGRYIFTHRTYNVNGKILKDPIDVAVAEWYKLGKQTNDINLINIAGMVKRKHHYLFHVILLDDVNDENEKGQYRILIDKSNQGKLARIICTTMGLPFFRSIQDNWVDKSTLEIDEDKEYVDLLDIKSGYDFRIIKKQIGDRSWDVSYSDSFAHKKPRPLTDKELECLNERINLKDYIQYEEDYFAVKASLDAFINSLDDSNVVSSNTMEKIGNVNVSNSIPADESTKILHAAPMPPKSNIVSLNRKSNQILDESDFDELEQVLDEITD